MNPMNTPLTKEQISLLVEQRRKQLEELKPNISRKLYFKIEEKLNSEEKTLLEILDWQNGKHAFMSRYTLILDPRYFEQEFLN